MHATGQLVGAFGFLSCNAGERQGGQPRIVVDESHVLTLRVTEVARNLECDV